MTGYVDVIKEAYGTNPPEIAGMMPLVQGYIRVGLKENPLDGLNLKVGIMPNISEDKTIDGVSVITAQLNVPFKDVLDLYNDAKNALGKAIGFGSQSMGNMQEMVIPETSAPSMMQP